MQGIISINQRNFSVWIGAISLLVFLILDYVDPFAVVMAYFIESILIGLLNIVKMLLSNKEKNKQMNGSLAFKCIFFVLHYGFFIFVQSVFVFAMFGMSDANIKEPYNVVQNFAYAFSIDGFGLSMAILTGVLVLETFVHYIRPKVYKQLSAEDLFFKPYIRVIVQQLTVLVALLFVLITGLDLIVALVLVLIRWLVDLTGIFITTSEDHLRRAARFVKKDHKRSDLEVMEELKKFL